MALKVLAVLLLPALLLFSIIPSTTAIHFGSGEFYHDRLAPFHSSEVDHHYLNMKHFQPDTKVHCFGFKSYPILNNYPKPKKAPPAPLFDDFDTMFGPQAITSGPILDDNFFDDDYLKYDDDNKKDDMPKVSFDVCYDMCPAPRTEKFVCGDDGRTYVNIYKLNCAVRCGRGELKHVILGICIPGNYPPGIGDRYFHARFCYLDHYSTEMCIEGKQ